MEHLKELQLKKKACQIRLDIIDEVYFAKSGHPGGSLSIADVLVYLYEEVMHIDPQNPKDAKRDRLVLSKGHTAPALYAVLAEKGFFDKDELKKLRKANVMLQGHPDMKGTPGIDMSTGSLGQGVSAAVGMALSAKMYKDSFHVYAVLGDGELQEGQVWEAAMLAGNHKLNNLIAIIDNNNLQIDGTVEEINSPYPIADKFKAFGWEVLTSSAHNFEELEQVFTAAKLIQDKPIAIIASSVKGKGVSFMENNVAWHGSPPNDEQYAQAKEELTLALQKLEVE